MEEEKLKVNKILNNSKRKQDEVIEQEIPIENSKPV